MTLVYGLTCDERMSWVSRVCCAYWPQQLGRISYALYTVHWPLIQYICFFVYGPERLKVRRFATLRRELERSCAGGESARSSFVPMN